MTDMPEATHTTKFSRFRFETVGTAVAIFIAVLSLFVAWDEAHSVRRQQAASVLPIIKIETRFMNDNTERSYRITVRNVGVGPAFLDQGEILWDGAPVSTAEDLRFNVEAISGTADFWTSEIEGQILGGGDTYPLYEVSWPPEAHGAALKARETVRVLREHVSISTCYCSVYDTCWTTDINRLGRPERTAQCRVIKDRAKVWKAE